MCPPHNMFLYVECINCEFHLGLEKGALGLISYQKHHSEIIVNLEQKIVRESMTAGIMVKRISLGSETDLGSSTRTFYYFCYFGKAI